MLEGKKERSLVNIKGQLQHWPNIFPFFSVPTLVSHRTGIASTKSMAKVQWTVLLAVTSSVGVLKERNKKERKKETPVKLKRQCFALA